MKTPKFIPWLLVGVGLLIYHNSLHNPFVLDDLRHIVQNPRIRHLWPPWEIILHTSRPIVSLSVALNYAPGGLNPRGYHLFNVGIHIFAALTLYGVVRRTLLSEGWQSRFGETASWLAGVISLIWLVHPLQTESVTYVIQRGESLMGLFQLLTLYCVIRSSDSSRSIRWRMGAVASCALGMATKPVMVTAPLVVLLYDRAFLAKSWREVRERRWALYAGLAATWLLLPLLLANAPAEWKETAGFASKGVSSDRYVLTQLGVILHYLRLAFWPHPLCLDYGSQYGWPAVRTVADVLPGLAVVGGLLLGTVRMWRRKPALGFLGAWFFLLLAPTSSFVPVADLVVEHRMYLPLAGVVALVTVGGFVLGRNLLSRQPLTRGILEWGLSGVIVLGLAVLTIQRNRDYRSVLSIWQDTVEKCPNNPRAHNNLGIALAQAGRVAEAGGQYEQALRLKPDYVEAHYNLGLVLVRQGRVQDAIKHWEQAVQLQPDYAGAHNNLGIVLAETGRVAEAIGQYEQALRLKPHSAEVHNNLGNVLLGLGKVREAIGHFEQAVQLQPDYAEAHNNLGLALSQSGKIQDAIGQYEQALRLKPAFAEAHCNLGLALEQTGRVQEAIRHYEQALQTKPDYPRAQNALAWLLATLAPTEGSDPARAVTLAEWACELTTNRVAAYLDTLAAAYAAAGRFDDAIATAQQAIGLARSAGQPQVVSEIETRLELYRAGRAYRQLRTPVRSQSIDVTSPHNP